MTTRIWLHRDYVVTDQAEARTEAARLNEGRAPGLPIAVAAQYPLNSWGGHNTGWTIIYVEDKE